MQHVNSKCYKVNVTLEVTECFHSNNVYSSVFSGQSTCNFLSLTSVTNQRVFNKTNCNHCERYILVGRVKLQGQIAGCTTKMNKCVFQCIRVLRKTEKPNKPGKIDWWKCKSGVMFVIKKKPRYVKKGGLKRKWRDCQTMRQMVKRKCYFYLY